MKVPATPVADYLNYQMFTKNMNTSQEVIRQYFE
jgi:hypothetical protein